MSNTVGKTLTVTSTVQFGGANQNKNNIPSLLLNTRDKFKGRFATNINHITSSNKNPPESRALTYHFP